MKVLSLFDGKYEVCSDGTVWSNVGKRKQMIGKTTRAGYRMIVSTIDGKKQYPLVHRLVAKAFIPNPKNKPEVKENFTTDTYTEQRKWIGKLCRFRHCDDTKWKYGILKDVIYDTSSCLVDIRYKMGGIEFRECEPVKPTDSIIYKGGDND